jgi:hypothetical protein
MCNPKLSILHAVFKDSRECLHYDNKNYSVFSIYFIITGDLAIGITCDCLNHATELVNSRNYIVDNWLGKEAPSIFIARKPIFRDGRGLCHHCKFYLNKLKGICKIICHPKITYL